MNHPSYQSLSDKALWTEYVDGSEAAFDEVRRRFQEPIFHYLILSGADVPSAAQSLGQILCRASLHRRQPTGFHSLKGWLFAIATQQAVPAHVPEQEGLTDFISELKRGEPRSREGRLLRDIADMRGHVRQPFLLVAVFGLSIQEAALACRFTPHKTARKVERGYREMAAVGTGLEDRY